MISATEISKKLDLNFHYKNLIGFTSEDELRKEYGAEFFEQFLDVFAEEWFSVIGDALQWTSEAEMISKCVNMVAKGFSEIEEGEVLGCDCQDYEGVSLNKEEPAYYFTPYNEKFKKVCDKSD